MNRIEKAEWAAAMLGGSGARSCRGPPLPGPGGTAAPAAAGSRAWRASRRRGRGAAPQPRYPAPSGLPFICWLCHFLSIADPFSVPSVISNNVTASLESIHQSRKKPMLTLIKKKKYHLCLMGKRSQPNLWRPRPPPPPASLPFEGAPGGNQIPRGRGARPQVGPRSPAHSPERSGAGGTGSERGLNPGQFSSCRRVGFDPWGF